ncbi:uncharacterized protein LOC127795848 [Diospyros lotus]|uniref:uncharacterized protein LOC127795848 n=1 Tax=Diospyros lotus TaxID=55363 RepID=UPI00224C9A0F|nr:uncharacterized protein LOC127795848 [Diospyros lotus]
MTARCYLHVQPNFAGRFPNRFSRQISFPNQRPHLGLRNSSGWGVKALSMSSSSSSSAWDQKPYDVLAGEKRVYLDEEDVVTFLSPPKELIPLDPASFNPAAYLWKKIEDIPNERRNRLLHMLKPRLIKRAWEIAGTRYEDPKLLKKSTSSLLSNGDGVPSLEFWNCRASGGPIPIAWINFFKKAIFRSKNGTFGRLIGGSVITELTKSLYPLYFALRQMGEVMSTGQPCDLAYEFGDGFLDMLDYPPGFPKPGRHPWPFNDEVVIYVRHLGPGVLVGQAWQEGAALEQVPQKLCGEILMVKDYASLCEDQ